MSYLEREESALQARETQDGLGVTFLSNVKAIRQYAASFFKERQDIDDLVQDVYLRVAERGGLADVRSPKAFLCKVARNIALNEQNRSGVRLSEPLEDSVIERDAPATLSLDEQAEQRQRFGHLCDAINELPTQCRRVFVMKKIDGLSNQEIAQALNISVSTVDKHLAKGMIECKEALKRLGHLEPPQKRRSHPALKPLGHTANH